MAANFGKFIDRSPLICAAGMTSRKLDQTDDDANGTSEKRHVFEENIVGSAHDEKLQAKNATPEVLQEAQIKMEALEITSAKAKDHEELRNTLNEANANDDSVTALMHPPRTPYQVLWDSQVGHENYRTTHDDYNAPKHIEESHEVGPIKCLKAAGKFNTIGVWVKCSCDWHKKEALDLSSDIEADHVNRTRSQVGKTRNPNHNIDSVPEGYTFGTHSKQASYGMEELMKDSNCPPCVFRRDFYKWMAALNKCRNSLRERRDQDFKFDEFYAKSLKLDKEKTGFLPIDLFYDICAEEHVTFHREEMESLLKVLHIIVDDKINYGRFIEIIDVTKPAIDIVPLHDLPKQYQYYQTSNQAACDYLITSNADLPPAGVRSGHDDVAEPVVSHPLHNWSEESQKNPINFNQAADDDLIMSNTDLPPAGVRSDAHSGTFEQNVPHPFHNPLHNWSEESRSSPLNFGNN